MRLHIIGLVLGLSIFSIFQPANAGDIKSKDWTWNIDDPEWVYATTENSADGMLGQFCDPEDGSCLYAVNFGITCEEGSRYPALVSTDQGSQSLELVCATKARAEYPLFFIDDFDKIDGIIRGAQRIGFVVAMQGDEFKAVRFSLRGATESIDLMRLAAEKLHARQGSKPAARPAVERL
jgi:hypothetical protein